MSTHSTDNKGSTGHPELFEKYDVPAPRYTSYPTVPYWTDNPNGEQWIESLNSSLRDGQSSWSLYCHIPFCEQLCTFCGCNTSITRDHGREKPYIDLLHKEWSMYLEKVPALKERERRQIR